ncbi:MAG: hypothetical protein AB7R89_26975 [Dehalococcoidia bacterium]
MHYALTRDAPESSYAVYGKGDDAAEAEQDASRNIHTELGDIPLLIENLIVVTREEAEHQGYVKPGAPVIWHDNLGRYAVEDHGPFHSSKLQRRLQDRLT